MATKDGGKAYVRFLAAHRRISEGLNLQHCRIVARTAQAPRLPTRGVECDVIDLRGDLGNDIDYYVYELARLQDLARAIAKAFGRPAEVIDGLVAFDAAIPALRKIRNPLTHPSDDERLDDVAWFDSVVQLHTHGAVEYLVDPRYGHHDAAIQLSCILANYLEANLQVTGHAVRSPGAHESS